MARGKTHDKFNLLMGAVLTGVLIGFNFYWPVVLAFSLGWLFSTLLFSPDTDFMPKKRAGFLRFFLYPYSLIFKHRGLSHHWLWGTLTRLIYGLVVFVFLIYLLHRLGHIAFSPEHFLSDLWSFLKAFDLSLWPYQVFMGAYLGMFMADLGHIFIDRLTSFLGRLWRFIA